MGGRGTMNQLFIRYKILYKKRKVWVIPEGHIIQLNFSKKGSPGVELRGGDPVRDYHIRPGALLPERVGVYYLLKIGFLPTWANNSPGCGLK